MAYIISLILALTALFTGPSVSPSQAHSQAHSQAPETHSQALSQALSATHSEAPVQAPNTSVEVAQRWAQAMLESADMELTPNVTLLFTSASNCGAEKSTAGIGGCTYTVAPNTYVVTISPELANTQWGNHILFHELGHTVGLGECEAESYAHQFEEVELWSYPLCETTGQPE